LIIVQLLVTCSLDEVTEVRAKLDREGFHVLGYALTHIYRIEGSSTVENRPEWMLGYFRQQVEEIIQDRKCEDAVEDLARLLTHYALMPPEVAKDEVRAED
jgi:hypothetical protein